MRKTVLKFGLISGAMLSAMMLATVPFIDRIGFDKGFIVGYSSMVVGFLLIYFGVRSYRDNVAGGSISFGRALGVGSLIALVASFCYVATWEAIYFGGFAPNFMENYQAYAIESAKAKGASEVELAATRAEMARAAEAYKNPIFNAGMTFLEPLPVALVMSLVTAGVLSRRRKGDVQVGSSSRARAVS